MRAGYIATINVCCVALLYFLIDIQLFISRKGAKEQSRKESAALASYLLCAFA